MPRKKVEVISSQDSIEVASPETQPITTVESVKTPRPRRKPAQPKVFTETESAATVEEAVEVLEHAKEVDQTVDIKLAESDSTESTELAEHADHPEPEEDEKDLLNISTLDKKHRKKTYTKEKFYIRNDLLERLKAITKGKDKKNLKTTLINNALEKLLNERELTKE